MKETFPFAQCFAKFGLVLIWFFWKIRLDYFLKHPTFVGVSHVRLVVYVLEATLPRSSPRPSRKKETLRTASRIEATAARSPQKRESADRKKGNEQTTDRGTEKRDRRTASLGPPRPPTRRRRPRPSKKKEKSRVGPSDASRWVLATLLSIQRFNEFWLTKVFPTRMKRLSLQIIDLLKCSKCQKVIIFQVDLL